MNGVMHAHPQLAMLAILLLVVLALRIVARLACLAVGIVTGLGVLAVLASALLR